MQEVTIGLQLPQEFTSIETLRDIWMLADESGFDSCWLFDHLAPLSSGRTGEVFESWTLVAAIAATTTRIRLGTLVTDITRRHPVLLAKMAATVDHLSAGRLNVGLGAGGDNLVDRVLNAPKRSPRERVAGLVETCRAMTALWAQDAGELSSKKVADSVSWPKPLQKPHPPLWLGSRGELFGLRAVAEWGDVWVPSTSPTTPLPELIRLSAVLDRHCAEVGRDPATIRRAIQLRLPADPSEAQRTAVEYVRAGFSDLILMVPFAHADAHATAEATAALLPRLRELR